MATKITARPNQSMQDLVLMACGTLDGAMAFCRANGVSISDVPVVANEYIIPDDIVRNKTVLRDLQINNIVLGTLYQAPTLPVAGGRVLLDPRMSVVAAADLMIPGWYMRLVGTGLFINYYDLMPEFDEVTNPINFQSMTDYLVMNSPAVVNANFAVPSSKLLRWERTAGYGSFNIFWVDLASPVITSSWRDVHGNLAVYAPLIGIKPSYATEQLIAVIDVVVEEVYETEVMFRITWTHAPVAFTGHYVLAGFTWLGAAVGGTPVFGIPNAVNVTLPIGIHTIGAATHYTSGVGGPVLPDSYKTVVIEVY